MAGKSSAFMPLSTLHDVKHFCSVVSNFCHRLKWYKTVIPFGGLKHTSFNTGLDIVRKLLLYCIEIEIHYCLLKINCGKYPCRDKS